MSSLSIKNFKVLNTTNGKMSITGRIDNNQLLNIISYKKIINEVIEGIAKEKGYTQILTLTGNNFAYIDVKHDITKLVLDKLGIKE